MTDALYRDLMEPRPLSTKEQGLAEVRKIVRLLKTTRDPDGDLERIAAKLEKLEVGYDAIDASGHSSAYHVRMFLQNLARARHVELAAEYVRGLKSHEGPCNVDAVVDAIEYHRKAANPDKGGVVYSKIGLKNKAELTTLARAQKAAFPNSTTANSPEIFIDCGEPSTLTELLAVPPKFTFAGFKMNVGS